MIKIITEKLLIVFSLMGIEILLLPLYIFYFVALELFLCVTPSQTISNYGLHHFVIMLAKHGL